MWFERSDPNPGASKGQIRIRVFLKVGSETRTYGTVITGIYAQHLATTKPQLPIQCCGSGSVFGLAPDSMGTLIRIRNRIRNPDQDPGGQK